jgi:hypothetical protein
MLFIMGQREEMNRNRIFSVGSFKRRVQHYRTANGHKKVEKDGGISEMAGGQPSFGMFLSWLFH